MDFFNLSILENNNTSIHDLYIDSNNFPVFEVILILCSIVAFLTVLVVLLIILCRKKQKREKSNDSFTKPSKEDKQIEECKLLTETLEPLSRDLNHFLNTSNKQSNILAHAHSKQYSNIIRQKSDPLLLSLSSQLPDYDSLFDSSPIIDKLLDTDTSHQLEKSNIIFQVCKSQKINFNHIEDDVSSLQECYYSDKLNKKLNKKSKCKSKSSNKKNNTPKVDASSIRPVSVHEYDIVYVPQNCAESMNNRLDRETSYIHSTWKKRKSILYEEINDVVRRISARIRPDSSCRQSSNSNSSNRASRNLDTCNKLNFQNDLQPIINCSDNNNNIKIVEQEQGVGTSCIEHKRTLSKFKNGTVPDVPKHAPIENAPLTPIRTASNKRKI